MLGVLGSRGKRAFAIGAFCLAWTLSPAPGAGVFVARAWGQSELELGAARRLFAEALADEQAGRHSAALDKFLRVQAVRDTQAVRYRIATCLEALGQLRAALAAYTSTSIAASTDTESASIVRASREKVDALSKRVARVIVTLATHSPPDAVVKIDGEALQPNAIGTPIVVDPGLHEIVATGSGSAPFHSQVTLPEGGQSTIEVTLAAPPALAPPPAPVIPESPKLPPPEPQTLPVHPVPETPPTPPPPPPAATSSRTTVGVVFVAAGGVLLAGATAILLLRNSDIQSLEATCPGGVCPLSDESALETTRNRALVEGPVGVGVGVAGVVAAGLGIYFLATKQHAPAPAAAAITPTLTLGMNRAAAGVAWNVRW
ncbi:MAG: hypothetical protein ACLQVI_28405 [Polyangiaceae bacterium]